MNPKNLILDTVKSEGWHELDTTHVLFVIIGNKPKYYLGFNALVDIISDNCSPFTHGRFAGCLKMVCSVI